MIAVIPGMRLSSKSKQAWKQAGVVILRERTEEQLRAWACTQEGVDLINLGKSNFFFNAPDHVTIWNAAESIKKIVTPGAARKTLDAFLPPRPTTFPAEAWIKAPGAGGRGKFQKSIDHELKLPATWDWQEHIEGDEYRVITVGGYVVQNLKREGSNGERKYTWAPIGSVAWPIKKMAKQAAALVGEKTIIAWDMIVRDEEVFILEGNTCPGMSEQTAKRIVSMIRAIQKGDQSAG